MYGGPRDNNPNTTAYVSKVGADGTVDYASFLTADRSTDQYSGATVVAASGGKIYVSGYGFPVSKGSYQSVPDGGAHGGDIAVIDPTAGSSGLI